MCLIYWKNCDHIACFKKILHVEDVYTIVYTQAACINLHVQGLLERSWILWFTEKNYCVLCRMMCVLLNDYQLKGSAQKIMILIIFPKDTVFFFLCIN